MTWHEDIPAEYRNTITTGDARELAARLPDRSVDCILTDPDYRRIDDYRWLSETAMRVLRPDSPCLAYYGIGYAPETHAALLAGGLTYRWRLVTRVVWKKEFHGRLIVTTQECLWYEKGTSRPMQSIFDCDHSTSKGSYNVGGANWGKGEEMLLRYVATFSRPAAVVFDPFCGSGSTPAACKELGRQYIGFEADPVAAENARRRLELTQVPLWVPEPVQEVLPLEAA